MRISDFDFDLPPELIAQHPLPERSASRLLQVDGAAVHDRMFTELPGLLKAGDLLVFNDTRVIKARLFGAKASGGKIEMLVERVLPASEADAGLSRRALVQMRASHAPLAGSNIHFDQRVNAKVLGREEQFFMVEFNAPVLEVLEQQGRLPLPPYIAHNADAVDDERYQTVFARAPGAVAAPTAGLHFDAALMECLQAAGVEHATLTLHVGAGTFQPVRVDNIAEHVMHAERYQISPRLVEKVVATRANGGRIISVGTTSLRALESAADSQGQLQAGHAETRIFITPGYTFKVVDAMITNFHLPKSTLLMLVSAFAGIERIRAAYAHAIAARYRFFSYGDAMLLQHHEEIMR